jgi:hypothetical protein
MISGNGFIIEPPLQNRFVGAASKLPPTNHRFVAIREYDVYAPPTGKATGSHVLV